jgi:hypothetical protein
VPDLSADEQATGSAELVIGMNRLRRGYLDLAPEPERYFVTGHREDVARIMQAYGTFRTRIPATHTCLAERSRVTSQWRRAVMIQARELNQTPSSLRCAESASRRRLTAPAAAAGSSRFSTSLVQVKPRTQSRAAATSGP